MIDFYYNTIFYILIIIIIVLLIILINRYFSNNSETYQDPNLKSTIIELIKKYHPEFVGLEDLNKRILNTNLFPEEIAKIKELHRLNTKDIDIKNIIDKIIYKYDVLSKLNKLQIVETETLVKDESIIYPDLPPNFLISKYYLEKYYNYIDTITPYIGLKPINKSIGNCFENCNDKISNNLYYIHINSKFLKFNGLNNYQTKHISPNQMDLTCKNNFEYNFSLGDMDLDIDLKNCINDIDMIFSLIKIPNKSIYNFYTTEQNIDGIKQLTIKENNDIMYPFYIVAPLKFPKVFISLDIKNDNSKTKLINIKYPLNEKIRNTQRFYFSEDKIPSEFKLLSEYLKKYKETCNNTKMICK
jgi:hypothetical protein